MTLTPEPTNPRRRWPRRLALTSASVVLATSGALIGISSAESGETSTVYACVDNTKGTVRIVSSTTTCARTETLRTWNVTGPAGPAGPQGTPGDPGAVPVPHQLVVGTMTVTGISGPNADGSADLRSFVEGLTIPTGDGGSGGASAGKPAFSAVTVSKLVDAMSPALLADAVTGQNIDEVVIRLFAPGSSTVAALYELGEVMASSDLIGNDGASPSQLLETIQLHFRTITVTVDGASFTYDTSGTST